MVKYKTDTGAPEKPTECKTEDELAKKLEEIQKRPEAVQIDVFRHDRAASSKLIVEWRTREAEQGAV